MTNETVDIRGIALSAIKRCRQAGESQEMLARWISEDVNRALAAQSQPAATVQEGDNCERCQGNGEIVTDWVRYLHGHDGDQGDEAVAECPDCNGTGHVDLLPSTERMRDALETIAHHSDGSPKGWAAATARAALTAGPAAKAGDGGKYPGLPMSDADLTKHYEASKHDVVGLVGSEVRQIIGELRHYRANPPSPQPDMGSEEAVSLSDILTNHDRTERYQHLGEGNRHYTCDAVEVLITDIKAALSTLPHKEEATPAPVGEQGAVAWMYRGHLRDILEFERLPEKYRAAYDSETPLYATPQSQDEGLRSVVERAQQIIGDGYVNWHEAARQALATPATTERGRGA